MEQRTLLAAFSWNTDSDGNWNDQANWNDGASGVPAFGDDVTIDRGAANPAVTVSQSNARANTINSTERIIIQDFELQVDSGGELGSVELLSGELDVRGTSTIGGDLDWNGGTLRLTNATISATSEFAIGGTADNFVGIIDQNGTVNQTAAFNAQGTIENRAGAEWIVAGDHDVNATSTFNFNNYGRFRKSIGIGESAFTGSTGARFNHFGGTVKVDEGKLNLTAAGNNVNNNNSTGASIIVAPTAVLDLNGGGRAYLGGTFTGTGGGRVEINGERIDTRSDGGTKFDFAPGMLHWTGGVVYTDNFGGDGFTNVGHMAWSGSGDREVWGQEFHNLGTIVQTDDGNSLFNSGGQGTWFHNEAGAVYENTGTGGIVGGRFYNSATLRNSAGDSDFNTALYALEGSVFESTGGRAILSRGGEYETSQINATGSGIIEFAKETGLDFKLKAGATISGSGDGRIEFTKGRIDSVNNDATINFEDGLFHWLGGTFIRNINSTGHITIDGDGGQKVNNAFTNFGTVIQLAGSIVNSSSTGIFNAEDALWEIRDDAFIGAPSNLVTEKFYNFGTLRKTGTGTSTLTASLSHQGGTVDVQEGTLKADHSNNAPSVGGGHFIVPAGSLFEIIDQLDGNGVFTAEGEGDIQINGRMTGNDGWLTLDFPEGMATVVTMNKSHHLLENRGHLTFGDAGGWQEFGWLRNEGTIVQQPGVDVLMANFSYVRNNGLWELQDDATWSLRPFDRIAAYVSNFGTIRKTGVGTSVFINDPGWKINGSGTPIFNNSGTVEVVSGVLEVEPGLISQLDVSEETLHGGTWYVGPGSMLKFVDEDGNEPLVKNLLGRVTLDGVNSTFANLNSLETIGGHFEITNGRDFSTAANLTNGVIRSDSEMTDVIPLTGGRFVGLAIHDGELITHARNQRIDGRGIFRVHDRNGVEIADPIVQPEPDGATGVLVSGLDVTSTPVNVGGIAVPTGSLLFIHGNVAPPTLYAVSLTTGEELASVQLTDVGTSQAGVALHPTRGTVFVLGTNSTITEVNAQNGSTIDSFSTRPDGSSFFSIGSWGGIDVNADGNLLMVGSSSNRRLRELSPTGQFVRDIDLSSAGMARDILSDISYDDATGEIWLSSETGYAFRFNEIRNQTSGRIEVGADSRLLVNGDMANAGRNPLSFEIAGRPTSGQFGRIEVIGSAQLAGDVQIREAEGYVGIAGDQYTTILFDTRNSTEFDFVDAPVGYSFGYADTGFVVSVGDLQAADFLATDVRGPSTVVAGQTVEVEWTVQNVGSIEIVGPWHDRISISQIAEQGWQSFINPGEFFFAQDFVEVETVQVGAGVTLGPGESRTFTAEVRVPGRELGEYNWRVDVNRRLEVFEASRQPGSNFAISDDPVRLDIPELVVNGDDINLQFTADIGQHWFRVQVPADNDIVVNLQSTSNVVSNLFAGQGFLPTPYEFHERHSEFNSVNTSLVASASGHSQTWYVLAQPYDDGAVGPFTISASLVPPSLDEVSPTEVGIGQNTVKISGKQLRQGLTYELVAPNGSPLAATAAIRDDFETVFATFDSSGLAAGSYDLVVRDGATAVDTLPDAIALVETDRGEIEVSISIPRRIRAGRITPFRVFYENTGNIDLPLPFMSVTTDIGDLRVRRDGEYADHELTIIPPSTSPGLTVLPAGERGTVTLYFMPPTEEADANIQVFANSVDDPSFSDRPIDWDAIRDNMRPDNGVDDAAWQSFIDAQAARYGQTYGDLHAYASEEIRYLTGRGYENVMFYEGFMRFDTPALPDNSVQRVAPASFFEVPAGSPIGSDGRASAPSGRQQRESGGSDGVPSTHIVVIGGGGNLQGAVSDANGLADHFRNGVNLPEGSTVKLVADENWNPSLGNNGYHEKLISSSNVQSAVKAAAERVDGNDVLVVINASHGSCGLSFGEDGRPMSTPALHFGDGSELTPAQMTNAMSAAQGQTVIVSDSCYSSLYTGQVSADIKIASGDITTVPDAPSFGSYLLDEFQLDPSKIDVVKSGDTASSKFYNNQPVYANSASEAIMVRESVQFDFQTFREGTFDRPTDVDGQPINDLWSHRYDEYRETFGSTARTNMHIRDRSGVAVPVIDRGNNTSFELPLNNTKSGGGGSGPEKEEGIMDQIEEALKISLPRDKADTEVLQSFDPNEKVGPLAVGEAGYFIPGDPMDFTIYFENDPEKASLPAQFVTVTEVLDDDLDLSTFELGNIYVGDVEIEVPDGLYSFSDTQSLFTAGIELAVRVDARLDVATRTATWQFSSIDLNTGEETLNALAGFLLINDETRRGEGNVSYTIQPNADLADGTVISGNAKIVFDVNEPIFTNTTTHTVDLSPPTSQVESLPASSGSPFVVSWRGDDNSGSGAASYDIYVSENDGPFSLWLTTTETSAVFVGDVDHTYEFYSTATDGVGLVEIEDAHVDATTTVVESTVTTDVDGDGNAQPLTDGILSLRYLAGFTGNSLTDGAVGSGGRTAAEIIAYLDSARTTMLDIDGDGESTTLSDGILFVRYLAGFRGDTLIASAVNSNGTRTTATEIEAYIEQFMPPAAGPRIDAYELSSIGKAIKHDSGATNTNLLAPMTPIQPFGAVVGVARRSRTMHPLGPIDRTSTDGARSSVADTTVADPSVYDSPWDAVGSTNHRNDLDDVFRNPILLFEDGLAPELSDDALPVLI